MRRLFWQISMSLDGFMEGPEHQLDDTAGFADPDFDRYASAMLQSIDDVVIGRRTYQLFVGYWPKASGPDAERLNNLPKLVCSRTLSSVQWNNARLPKGDVVAEVTRLKQRPGRDIALFGSARLAGALSRQGLIDEYRMLVTPVVMGRGNPAFADPAHRARLALERTESWSSGTVALFYRRDGW